MVHVRWLSLEGYIYTYGLPMSADYMFCIIVGTLQSCEIQNDRCHLAEQNAPQGGVAGHLHWPPENCAWPGEVQVFIPHCVIWTKETEDYGLHTLSQECPC